MASEVSDRVRTLASERDVAESAIIQEAIEAGLETLWRDYVVSQYLDGEVSRADAVEELGEDVVRDVERARDAVDADVEWGLHGADS